MLNSLKQSKLIFNIFVNHNWKKLIDSRKRAKNLADNRKRHLPIETLQYGWIYGQILLLHFVDRDEIEVNDKKRTTPIFSYLDRTSLVNKGLLSWPNGELYLAGPTREIQSGQNGPIFPAQVAN